MGVWFKPQAPKPTASVDLEAVKKDTAELKEQVQTLSQGMVDQQDLTAVWDDMAKAYREGVQQA